MTGTLWSTCSKGKGPWASHPTRYLWLLPSVDAVGTFGPEDIKIGNSRPEFPKLDVSTTLSVISSQGSKHGKGKQNHWYKISEYSKSWTFISPQMMTSPQK